jgi:hypothetical protein
MQSSVIPNNLEALLSREAAAQALTAAGYVTSSSTLATKATRGNGPAYRKFGKRAIYRWGDLVAWAEANTAPLRHNTSELTPISAGEPARRLIPTTLRR